MMIKNGSCLEKNDRKEQSGFRWISSEKQYVSEQSAKNTLCVLRSEKYKLYKDCAKGITCKNVHMEFLPFA